MLERSDTMKIFILFTTLYITILLIKILANLKFKRDNEHIISTSTSIQAEFSDNDIPLSQALRNFKHCR